MPFPVYYNQSIDINYKKKKKTKVAKWVETEPLKDYES